MYKCTYIISHLSIKVYLVGNMMWFIIVFFKNYFPPHIICILYMYNVYYYVYIYTKTVTAEQRVLLQDNKLI
jgi:hypothetical protein